MSCGILNDLRFIIFCVCDTVCLGRNCFKTAVLRVYKDYCVVKTKFYIIDSNRCQYLELTEILANDSCALQLLQGTETCDYQLAGNHFINNTTFMQNKRHVS